MNSTATETSPELLREEMIAKIKDSGYTLSPTIERALRTVERHLFVPDVPLEEAYENDIVVTKRDADGQVLSCLSQPSIVALQLEQLQVQPGDHVLEIGAGAGYNAALLAHLVGPHGRVTAIDVDADIVDQARQGLVAAGVSNVEVVLTDGALGHSARAPFDRIVATVGAYGIPHAWLTQLAPAGTLVVPTRIQGSVSRSIAFQRKQDGEWRSSDHQMCGFVPLRKGIADDPRRKFPLTTDDTIRIQLNQEHTIDPAGLIGVFDRPRSESWTGATFEPMQSLEWLYLWLACTLDTGLCSMSVEQAATDAGLVDPMFPSSTMAVPGEAELAYLTRRSVGRTEDGGAIIEIGVIGHSDTGSELSHRVAQEIRTWNEQHRDPGVQFELPQTGTLTRDPDDPNAERFILDRPHHPLVITWR